MHLPDHVLDPTTCLVTGAASVACVGYALHRVRVDRPGTSLSLIGVTAAWVFTIQMLNFPISGTTSGHLLGGALAGILLGPWIGMLTVASVLLIQAILFQDGGLTALGANVRNMAVIGSGAGYLAHKDVTGRIGGVLGKIVGVTAASWVAVMLGATLCSLELALGAGYLLKPTLGQMIPGHLLVAACEAMVCGALLAGLMMMRAPQSHIWGRRPARSAAVHRRFVPGLVLVTILAAVLVPIASSYPDVLQVVLEQAGDSR